MRPKTIEEEREEREKKQAEILCDELLEAAEARYGFLKRGESIHYTAPELRPKLQSDQVRALAYAVSEALVQIRNETVETCEPRKRDDY